MTHISTDYAFDTGSYSREITTNSDEAQLWFDRGLMWTYGFNHDEAESCFEKAIVCDETCAMAYWGLAYVKGPFINKTWDFFTNQERGISLASCYELSQKALHYSQNCTPEEKAFINAITKRYSSTEADTLEVLYSCNDSYALAMRQAHYRFPEDLDIIALFAEAMMIRTPWRLWDIQTREPQEGTDTLEIIAVLEKALELVEENNWQSHAGIIHMYIHAVEMSPNPEKALNVADQIRHVAPDVGHLLHMPSHIDVLCGHYFAAIEASRRATKADEKYIKQVGPYGFYSTACCHDYHLMMFAAMQMGNYRIAKEAVDGIAKIVSKDVLLNAATPYLSRTLENYLSTKMHVEVRFGMWEKIIAQPAPDDAELYRLTTVMHHYAQGVAHAALGNIQEAEEACKAFQNAVQDIDPDRHYSTNKAVDVLAVAREMLNGELEYHKGNYDVAFERLREAVYLNDNLAYTEPWAWMHPPRHALAALLLEQGYVEEAEQVCRADLGLDASLSRPTWHPNNVWMLHAYLECLERLGKVEEMPATKLQLDFSLARADVEITSSCCCRKETREVQTKTKTSCCST